MSRIDEPLRRDHADALLMLAEGVAARFSTAHGDLLVTVEIPDGSGAVRDPRFVAQYDGRGSKTIYPFDAANATTAARGVARELQNRRYNEPAPVLLGFEVV